MESFKRYAKKYGLPCSVYPDKHTYYKSQVEKRALLIAVDRHGLLGKLILQAWRCSRNIIKTCGIIINLVVWDSFC